jgi:hypothetical protein
LAIGLIFVLFAARSPYDVVQRAVVGGGERKMENGKLKMDNQNGKRKTESGKREEK